MNINRIAWVTVLCLMLSMDIVAMKRAFSGYDEGPDSKKQKIGQVMYHMDVEPSSPFKGLPIEVRGEIFLKLAQSADSLDQAVQDIRNYADPTKHPEYEEFKLRELLNESTFCLKLIKILSERFGRSNMTVADALKTKEAIRRVQLQKDLIYWCKYIPNVPYIPNVSRDRLEELYQNGLDVEFTSSHDTPSKERHMVTPLIIAVMYGNEQVIKFLIDKGANVNSQLSSTKSPPLLYCILGSYNKTTMKRSIEILLDAGADPELGGGGTTPLQAAQKYLIDGAVKREVIDMLQDAIAKKQRKK